MCAAVGPAALGALCFCAALIGQVAAVSALGDATGTPLTQLNLVVAAFWGVLLYGEVHGTRALILFALSVVAAAASAVLLLLPPPL